VKLHNGKTFWHHLQRGVIVQGAFANDDTPGVYRQMIGQTLQFFTEIKNVLRIRMVLFRGHGFVHQQINVCFGQPEYLTQFPDDRSSLEGAVRGQQCGAFPPVSFENIIGDVVPLVPTEINIEIWWGGTVWVDKTLEIQIELQRIYIGNEKAKRYDRVGPAAPPNMVLPLALGIAYDIPGDEKIGGASQLGGHLQFFFHALQGPGIGRVPLFASTVRQLREQYHVLLPVLGEALSLVL